MSVQQLADRTVLDRFAPPGLLVNEALEVVQFRGQLGAYLAPALNERIAAARPDRWSYGRVRATLHR